ncbi:hypothetical protein MVLG_07224 [Microbotryum lychnidis-dioicae p1A1 Lamole]|uniref:Uncharacterized protein n=1 Tax=Microbotryum lychnidis-dioicae (strain p1A1 Lamole / MvSl-1064) TaxID=683840 RepID=U5HJP5_USTV1|nr:hypothetical protein MVLG_07224 [Microbotryum lychnidis-dioicae p1A1 Lamole]|eukprot:KDE02205.1 hypothetical protein MVLG_07224 [Microbotryum lychnidis-dioicae p1A1 Lamole]
MSDINLGGGENLPPPPGGAGGASGAGGAGGVGGADVLAERWVLAVQLVLVLAVLVLVAAVLEFPGGASDSHKKSFSSYNVTTSHSRASLVSAYTDSPITVPLELFDIASKAARPEAIPMSLFTPGASIKVKLGQTISLATTKDRSATLQLGHQLDHLLTFDEWQPSSFLHAALMADTFKTTNTGEAFLQHFSRVAMRATSKS